MHLSAIREQLNQAIKTNPDDPESPIFYQGVGSNHTIEIKI